MANLQDLINLAKADGGKFFVMDEKGDAKLVIMSVGEYERLLLSNLQRKIKEQNLDIEKVNKMITEAQLKEPEAVLPAEPVRPSRRPSDFGPKVSAHVGILHQDLRAEVIDPSFDFEGPKVEIDDL